MASKTEYSLIPDVEQPAVTESPIDPKELYPGTSNEEAEFLGTVDECINGSRMDIQVEHSLSEEDHVDTWTGCGCLCVMTLWGITTIAGAVYIGNAKIQRSARFVEYFPYVAAFVLFLISSFIIDGRIMSHVVIVFRAVEGAVEMVTNSIDNLVKAVSDKVTSIQSRLSELLAPIKQQMDAFSQKAGILRTIDPDLEIPDPTEVGRGLDRAADQIAEKSQEVKDAIDLDSAVPSYLRSECSFRCRSVFPLLFLFLVIQMLAAYCFTQYYPLAFAHKHLSINVTALNESMPVLNATAMNATINNTAAGTWAKMLNETTAFIDSAESHTVTWVADAWYYVLAVLQAYVVAFIEIWLVVCCTGVTATNVVVSKVFESISDSANRVAREKGLTDLCEDILGTRMKNVKTNYLALLDKRAKLEDLRAKAPSVMPRRSSKTIHTATVTAVVESPKNKESAPRMAKKQSSRFGRFFGKGKSARGKKQG